MGVVLVAVGVVVLHRIVIAVRIRPINGTDEAEAYGAAVAAVQGVGYFVLVAVLAAVRRVSFGPPQLHPSAQPGGRTPAHTLPPWPS